MRIETRPGVILVETLLFGVMVGAICAVGTIIVGGWTLLSGIATGTLVGLIVWYVFYKLTGEMPPPRGPGNLPEPTGTDGMGGPSAHHNAGPAAGTPGAASSGATASGAPNGAAEAAPTASAPAPQPDPSGPMEKPVLLEAARHGQPDDLKQIKGVGPKLEANLHALGVYHFDQIAHWNAAEVAWVDEHLEAFKGRVVRDGWVDQARALAGGAKETA